MSLRAQDFLDNLIEEFAATGQSPSADLASIAIEEAADEGMSEDELFETVGGDLNAYLAGKLLGLRTEEEEDAVDPGAESEAESPSSGLSGLQQVMRTT
ncbi:hypothetical protein [Aureimonas psammosilenae]|uniref:hypothetical protein n=1 Tax=Aureimonas psammosilenae TaxID=2495496 RepID=UPI0012606FF5|nr:hypothetical protein [Aureimonas psammosilenae]